MTAYEVLTALGACSRPHCTRGMTPRAALVQASPEEEDAFFLLLCLVAGTRGVTEGCICDKLPGYSWPELADLITIAINAEWAESEGA